MNNFKIFEKSKKLYIYNNIRIDESFVKDYIKSGDISEWCIYVKSNSIKVYIFVDIHELHISSLKSTLVIIGSDSIISNILILDSNKVTLLVGLSSKTINLIRLVKSTDVYIQANRFIEYISIGDSILTYIESPYIKYMSYMGQINIKTVNSFISDIRKLSQYKLIVNKSPQYELKPFESELEWFDIDDVVKTYMMSSCII